MFSRIQDLNRYKSDCTRFEFGIQGVLNEHTKKEGRALFDALLQAVMNFDQSTANLASRSQSKAHMDHAAAQEKVRDTKIAMEAWMMQNAPNVHMETTTEFDK